MSIVLVLIGLALLFIGGESLVRGSVGLARRLGVSELVIGLTLIGFGTSAPELMTSIRAINQDAVGISVGNVTGSNIANTLLVLGVAAMIAPIATKPRAVARDLAVMAAVTAQFCALVFFDLFDRWVGVLLVAELVAYLLASLWLDQRDDATEAFHVEEGEAVEGPSTLAAGAAYSAAGLAGVLLGARILVDGAVDLAAAIGVSETAIGLSIVAIGTSLPELATASISAFRGKSDVALGNVIGSNIFNVLGIIGVTAIVHPFSLLQGGDGVARGAFEWGEVLDSATPGAGNLLNWSDVGALVFSAALVALFISTGKRIARWEAAILLLGYGLYMALVFK